MNAVVYCDGLLLLYGAKTLSIGYLQTGQNMPIPANITVIDRARADRASKYFVYNPLQKNTNRHWIYGMGMTKIRTVYFERFNAETWRFELMQGTTTATISAEIRIGGFGIMLPNYGFC